MKKILIVLMILVLSIQIGWSQTSGVEIPEKLEDISFNFDNDPNDPDGKFVYKFGGFDFSGYQISDPSLTTLNEMEINYIKQDSARLSRSDGGRYSILGHSQGGLRALGYISQLEKNGGTPDDIDAIITTSAIDQGLPMLAGGLDGFKARATPKINILGNGINAAIGIFDIPGIINLFLRDTASSVAPWGLKLFRSLIPPQLGVFTDIWNAPYTPKQVADMIPESEYIKTNVATTTPHTYKAISGYKQVFEWRVAAKIFGIKIYAPSLRKVPVYSYYTMPEVTPVFNPKVPVGFIVGTDSDTLGMNSEHPRGVVNAFASVFAITEIFHIVKCMGIIGLFTGSPVYIADAHKANRFCANIDSELNNLKLSRENDGLVAVSGQYIPKAFKDPNTGEMRTKLHNPVLSDNLKGFDDVHLTHNKMGEGSTIYAITERMIIDAEEERELQGLR